MRRFYVAFDIVFRLLGVCKVSAHYRKEFYLFGGEFRPRERGDFVWRGFEQPRGGGEEPDRYVDDAPVFGFRQNFPREFYRVGEFASARRFGNGEFGGSGFFSPAIFPANAPGSGVLPSAIWPIGMFPLPQYSF